MNKKIIVLTGDPNSINSELIFKAWNKINLSTKKNIYFISNYNLLKSQFKKLGYMIQIEKVKDLNSNIESKKLKIINIDLNFKNSFNVEKKHASRFILKSLNLAHHLALNNDVQGIINCPISKKLLIKEKIGVTEYLSKKCKIKDGSEVMLISNEKLSVCPITTHIDLKEVHKKIKSKLIIKKISTINKWFTKRFNRKPKIGILGLNPHNAEFRKNSEEKRIILPAILKLKKNNIKLYGPLPSDTLFMNDYKNYDIIVGMYHDQVLSPFKTLYKFNAINITLGLKYLRVSPDHGVAKNLIGKKKANEESFIRCLEFLKKNK